MLGLDEGRNLGLFIYEITVTSPSKNISIPSPMASSPYKIDLNVGNSQIGLGRGILAFNRAIDVLPVVGT